MTYNLSLKQASPRERPSSQQVARQATHYCRRCLRSHGFEPSTSNPLLLLSTTQCGASLEKRNVHIPPKKYNIAQQPVPGAPLSPEAIEKVVEDIAATGATRDGKDNYFSIKTKSGIKAHVGRSSDHIVIDVNACSPGAKVPMNPKLEELARRPKDWCQVETKWDSETESHNLHKIRAYDPVTAKEAVEAVKAS